MPDAAPQDPTDLSLCMIVRDAAGTLNACLESIRPWVDEMIVVDTGSDDDSPQIAGSLGAEVFHFPWSNDFAAARNESLRHACGRWIFWMDADDTIDRDNGRKLCELACKDAADELLGYVMQVHCPGPGGQADADVTVVDHVKMFRNRPDLRFEGRIHEQILPSIRRAGGEVAWTDVFVVHSGYDHSPEGQAAKRRRDLHLLQLDLADRPNHPFVLFNLGMTYSNMGDLPRAIETLSRCVIVSQPTESHLRKAYALLASAYERSGERQIAWAVCQTGRRLFPEDAELLYREGKLCQHLGRLPEAEQVFRRLLDHDRPHYFASMDRGITGFRARHDLAAVYMAAGVLDRAEEQLRLVVREQPAFLPAWTDLGEVLLNQGKVDEALRWAEQMQQEPQLSVSACLLKARLWQARGEVERARTELEAAVDDHADQLKPLESLCELLFEKGPLDAAESALLRLTARLPNDGAARHNLGTIYLRQQRFDDAIRAYRQSLSVRPGAPQTYLHLGIALEKAGRPAEAAGAWREVTRRAPDSALAQEARNNIKRLG